jgi:hypothetical protein
MKNGKNQHRRKLSATILLAFAFAFLVPVAAIAEILGSTEWGYTLDLPEGYSLAERKDTTRYHFTHSLYPVDLLIALYPKKQFDGAEKALSFIGNQLGTERQEVTFRWRNRDAAIGQVASDKNSGWTLAVELAGGKGWLALACITGKDRATELEPLIISTLDSVITDEGSWFETGPMTAFAYAKQKAITGVYDDGKRKLEVPFDSVDAEANQSVVDREFNLLTGYLNTPYVYAAWKRYYRLIYRDAWARLAKAGFILENNLPAEPEKIAAELLSWTQGFTYERNLKGSDFDNLPDAFMAKKADCDSRSLLLVILLNQMGIDAVLLVSPEYSHAVAAIDCPGTGAHYTLGNKKYLIADTTAKVGLGLIAEDMADPAKWFAVSFPAFPQADEKK